MNYSRYVANTKYNDKNNYNSTVVIIPKISNIINILITLTSKIMYDKITYPFEFFVRCIEKNEPIRIQE